MINKDYKKEISLKNGQVLITRTAEKNDAFGLINHMKQVDKETKFLGREPEEFNFTIEQEESFIENLLRDNKMCFLVGVVDNEIVANVSVGIIRNNKRFLHRASLGITVQRKFWNNGIGKELMTRSIEWCKENGIEQLELEVVSSNSRALDLYKSYGFEVYGTKKNALKYSDGTYSDEYNMILFLE